MMEREPLRRVDPHVHCGTCTHPYMCWLVILATSQIEGQPQLHGTLSQNNYKNSNMEVSASQRKVAHWATEGIVT